MLDNHYTICTPSLLYYASDRANLGPSLTNNLDQYSRGDPDVVGVRVRLLTTRREEEEEKHNAR